ncbi:MAG TPA: sigma-70 family RNA polymerase sigma factor [Planctomycetaceae bacterium]|nr:sigma-70 family RNA polymerase sigma factor [Planctomycetaceae bacterium]
MVPETSFCDLVQRVRRGDGLAAEELVRAYEPEVRRAIRVRLTDARLRRLVDSVDICQSVLAGFFVRTAAGQFDLQTPEQLLKLLVTMARNRVIDWARHANADRRDGHRQVSLELDNGDLRPLAEKEPSPVSVLVNRELLDRVRDRLSPAERQLMEQRAAGQEWDEIAKGLGEQANAVRMRLTRALDRVAAELGLEASHA